MGKYVLIIFCLLMVLIALFAMIYKVIYTKKINKKMNSKKGNKIFTPLSSTITFSLIVLSLGFLSLFIILQSNLVSKPVEIKTPTYGVDEYVLSDIGNNSIYAIYVPILNERGEIPGYSKEVDESNKNYVVTIYYELTSSMNRKNFIILLEYYGQEKVYNKTEIGLLYKNKDKYLNTSVIIEDTNGYVFFGYVTQDVDLKIIYNQLRTQDNDSDYVVVDSFEKEVSFVYENRRKK